MCVFVILYVPSVQMAERFGLPVVTLVDTVGAWPTFECERDGQSEVLHLLVPTIYITALPVSGSHSYHLLFPVGHRH